MPSPRTRGYGTAHPGPCRGSGAHEANAVREPGDRADLEGVERDGRGGQVSVAIQRTAARAASAADGH